MVEKIKALAKEKGMSINDVEERAGLSKGAIYKWNAVSPIFQNVMKVAKVLDCTVEELVQVN